MFLSFVMESRFHFFITSFNIFRMRKSTKRLRDKLLMVADKWMRDETTINHLQLGLVDTMEVKEMDRKLVVTCDVFSVLMAF